MPSKNTKIIATVGPANADEHTLRCLMEAGADVFRLNFSHGNHDDHRAVYQRIRALEESLGKPAGVLIDLQGPKLRLGVCTEGSSESIQDGMPRRLFFACASVRFCAGGAAASLRPVSFNSSVSHWVRARASALELACGASHRTNL